MRELCKGKLLREKISQNFRKSESSSISIPMDRHQPSDANDGRKLEAEKYTQHGMSGKVSETEGLLVVFQRRYGELQFSGNGRNPSG